MKVKELIELLQDFNPDAEILVDSRLVDITADDSSMYDTPTVNLST